MAQSALIVPVPEAQSVVGRLRERHDPAAMEGAPPHITTPFPFVDPLEIDGNVIDALRAAVSDVPTFEFCLRKVARFPATVYLAPEPTAPFVNLTRSIVRTFPSYPPYGGQFDAVVPHLTVAHGPPHVLEAAELELVASLSRGPELRLTCKAISLITNTTGRWAEVHQISLGSLTVTRRTVRGSSDA